MLPVFSKGRRVPEAKYVFRSSKPIRHNGRSMNELSILRRSRKTFRLSLLLRTTIFPLRDRQMNFQIFIRHPLSTIFKVYRSTSTPFTDGLNCVIFRSNVVAIYVFPRREIFHFTLAICFGSKAIVIRRPVETFCNEDVDRSRTRNQIRMAIHMVSPLRCRRRQAIFLGSEQKV